MNILYWLSYSQYLIYSIFVDNWVSWLTGIVSLMVAGGAKYVWSSFRKWSRKRRRREEDKALQEEWEQSLKLRELSLSGKRLLGRREPGTGVGLRPSSKSSPSGTGGIVTTCSSKAHRGKYGLWAQLHKGPNIHLIEARESLKLARFAAAEKLGVEEQELGRWERGDCLPSREMLPRICEGYGMSAEALGFGELERAYAKKPRRSQKQNTSASSIARLRLRHD